MKKEQCKKIADQVVPHIEAILEILTANEIESMRLYITSSDGYFSASLSQSENDREIEIYRPDSDHNVRWKVSEDL